MPNSNSLRKVNSTNSMEEENVMKKSVYSMYDVDKFNHGSNESLLANIERFLKAVNTMSHIVMVPSKLLDVETEEEVPSSNSSDASSNSGLESVNLYDAYRILIDAKENLIWNNSKDTIHNDDLSKKFKYHLDSLNSLVAHFAELADELTGRYQQQTELE